MANVESIKDFQARVYMKCTALYSETCSETEYPRDVFELMLAAYGFRRQRHLDFIFDADMYDEDAEWWMEEFDRLAALIGEGE